MVQGQSFSIPWPNSEAYNRFKELYGTTHRNSKIKKIGCYLFLSDNGDSYVGQSTHISNRIRIHLLGRLRKKFY